MHREHDACCVLTWWFYSLERPFSYSFLKPQRRCFGFSTFEPLTLRYLVHNNSAIRQLVDEIYTIRDVLKTPEVYAKAGKLSRDRSSNPRAQIHWRATSKHQCLNLQCIDQSDEKYRAGLVSQNLQLQGRQKNCFHRWARVSFRKTHAFLDCRQASSWSQININSLVSLTSLVSLNSGIIQVCRYAPTIHRVSPSSSTHYGFLSATD